MNILFVNYFPFNPRLGGIERVTDLLAKSLINKGYNIFYLSGHVENKELLDYDFPATMNTLPEEGMFSSKMNIEFYKSFIRSHSIDVIINQRGLETSFNPILEFKDLKKISVLHSTPNAYLKTFSKVFHKPQKVKEYIKEIIKFLFYPIIVIRNKRKAFNIISNHYNYISDNSDVIVLLSTLYVEEFYSFKISKKDTPIYSIPNPNTFPVQPIDVRTKEKIILYVGRLEAMDKNPIQLLKIWTLLNKKYSEWKLVIVGDGKELNNMRKYVQNKNLTNVYFEGKKNNVIDYYKRASIVCLTSNFEGWPMVLTEGMVTGCIPFAFNTFKAASDIIDEGINGFLITPNNIKEYALKLSDVMSDPIKRKAIAENALIKAQNFELDKIILKWEDVINSLYKD